MYRTVGRCMLKQYGYPVGWKLIAKAVKVRDNYTCRKCKRKHLPNSPNLHVHHIVSISDGGTSDPSNLMTLCKWCHASKHPHMYITSKSNKSKMSFKKTRKYTLKKKGR